MSGESRAAHRLEGLAPRTGQTERRFAEAERHRRRVSRLKIALPALALVSAAAIFVSLALNQRADEHVAGAGTPGIEMHAPVLKGTGDNGKPYEVVAAEAAQSREGLVALTEVAAKVELEDGLMTLTARSGTLHPETGATSVSGGVVIELGGIYRFETERAEGNMKTGIFSGDAPVKVTGPMGTIEAAGFRIEKSVKQVTFTGGVTSVFDPAAAKAADPGSKDKTP